MKSQFIEVKAMIEVITDEEISYMEAETMARQEVQSALFQRFSSPAALTEQLAPPYFNLVEVTT